ncbi:MAG: SDR family NAD(P)-dependent oxidoreductase, partial [Phaeodactylibacter sp.]|nr:SDR family NAD(P)-dependent oxidoreductase [Phaeodactylibacter sp.]
MNSKKVVLITGASSGMGKDAALQLIQEGNIVYGAARRVNKMKSLVEAGGYALEMDVTQEEQIVAGVKKIMEEQGRIDVLVNNAGYAVYGAVEDISMEDARRQFDVNIFGLARLTKEVLPHMRKQKAGKIINISSMGGKVYTPLGAWYHA